ncbi:N-acetylglucosamine-6-phosphate deacetylase [bacterium]|nr:N-acetylglucosamine-6-phosphate deacetylase [bacterium]
MIFLRNGEIYTPEEVIKGNILIEDGKIKEIGDLNPPMGAEVIDLGGKIVAPGFIDVHTHGLGGYDAMDGRSAIEEISALLPRYGVVGFLPTGVASSHQKLIDFLKDVREARRRGAKILGAHLESPYISMDKRGAQPPEAIRPVDMREIEELIEAGVKMVTIAPEVEGALKAIKRLKEAGVIVSLGHSNASWEEALKGINAGISKATHTFNAMPSLHHRNPGCVGLMLVDERIACEVIADFIHLHPIIVKLIIKAKGKDKVILITDSASYAGLPDGEYKWMDGRIVVKREGRIAFKDAPDVLAGSTLTLDQAVRNVASLGFPLKEVIQMASLNPAREAGLEGMGRIRVGGNADLVVLDSSLQVQITIINGEIIYKRLD